MFVMEPPGFSPAVTTAATVDFPLGVPLAPGGETTLPIDVTVSFAELPGLGAVLRRAIGNQPIAYRFEGTVGVDAGRFGAPEFGPMTLWRGTIRSEPRPGAFSLAAASGPDRRLPPVAPE